MLPSEILRAVSLVVEHLVYTEGGRGFETLTAYGF